MDNEEKVQALLIDLRQLYRQNPRVQIAAEYISNMYDALILDARCPCCDEVDACDDECTFSEDCPTDAERMEWVRGVLKVPV